MKQLDDSINSTDVIAGGKFYRGTSVGVLISPGYGAGWSTWDYNYGDCILFDPVMVGMVDQKEFVELAAYVAQHYPELYAGGMEDLKVAWIPLKTHFKVTEYDGAESIEYKSDDGWRVA